MDDVINLTIISPLPTTTTQNQTVVIHNGLVDLHILVFTIAMVISIISIISAGILLYTFQRYVNTAENTEAQLIKCLTLWNGISCFAVVSGLIYYNKSIGFQKGGPFCTVQSAISTYADLVCDILTMFVVMNHFCEKILRSTWMRRKIWKIVYHGFALIVPSIIIAVALSRNALGDAPKMFGSWCWISNSLSYTERWIWMIVTKLGFESLVYLVTFLLLFRSACIQCKRARRRARQKQMNKRIRRSTINEENEHIPLIIENTVEEHNDESICILAWVGLYFYLTKVWGTIRYFVHIAAYVRGEDNISGFVDVDKYFFVHLQSFGDSLQATINCILFVFLDRNLRQRLCGSRNRGT